MMLKLSASMGFVFSDFQSWPRRGRRTLRADGEGERPEHHETDAEADGRDGPRKAQGKRCALPSMVGQIWRQTLWVLEGPAPFAPALRVVVPIRCPATGFVSGLLGV